MQHGLNGKKGKAGSKETQWGKWKWDEVEEAEIREMEVRTCDLFVIKGLMWRTCSHLSATRVRVRNTRTQPSA